jgi:hypothetical protein
MSGKPIRRRKPLNGGIPFKLADPPKPRQRYDKRRKKVDERIKAREAKQGTGTALTEEKVRESRTKIRTEAEIVEGMALVGATNDEIADYLLCSTQKLTNTYAEVLTKARAAMKEKLRRYQWRSAKAGNPALLIWLGKQYLGQRETAKLEIDWGDMTIEELRELEQGRIPARIMAKARIV